MVYKPRNIIGGATLYDGKWDLNGFDHELILSMGYDLIIHGIVFWHTGRWMRLWCKAWWDLVATWFYFFFQLATLDGVPKGIPSLSCEIHWSSIPSRYHHDTTMMAIQIILNPYFRSCTVDLPMENRWLLSSLVYHLLIFPHEIHRCPFPIGCLINRGACS